MAIQLPANSTGTILDTVTVASKDRQVVNKSTDTGRTAVTLIIDNIAAVASEAIISYGGHRGGAALTAGTNAYTVTTNKELRIVSMVAWATGTVLDRVRIRLRAIVPTATVSAPIYCGTAVVIPANGGATSEVSFGDGIAIPSGFQVVISAVGATTSTYGVIVTGFEYQVV